MLSDEFPRNNFFQLFQPNEKNFRFYVKVHTALNIDPWIIGEELQSVFADKAPSKFIIEKWSQYHQEKDATSEDIEEVRSLIDAILHIIINETEVNGSIDSDTNEQIPSEMTTDQLFDKNVSCFHQRKIPFQNK